MGQAVTLENMPVETLPDPDTAIELLGAMRAEKSLLDFVRLAWPVLEPGRVMIEGWVLEAICEHLEAITSGDIRRLLINVPPGTMKSLLVNVFWPAWVWGPTAQSATRFIGASYADSLAVRDNRKCRVLVQSEVYRRLWGDRFVLVGDQNEKRKFENDRTGWRLATSVGGVGTGERADFFCIDDPHNVKTAESDAIREDALQWFAEVVPTRLNDPDKSAIVVIMQRTHHHDVSGLVLANELGYEHLCLPMEFEREFRCYTSLSRKDVEPERVRRVVVEDQGSISRYEPDPEGEELWSQDRREEEGELLWPERFSRHHLEDELKPQLRSWGGTYAEAGQLQQRPVPRGGGMFKREHFQFMDECPPLASTVRGWDLAATEGGRGAFTAGVKIGRTADDKYIVMDARRGRWSPAQVDDALKTTAGTDGIGCAQSLPQDPGQAGKSQKRYMAGLLSGFIVHFSPETGSKPTRAASFAAQVECGNVYLIRGPWNDAYLAEVCMFTGAGINDQVDGSSRAFAWLVLKKGARKAAGPQVVGR